MTNSKQHNMGDSVQLIQSETLLIHKAIPGITIYDSIN